MRRWTTSRAAVAVTVYVLTAVSAPPALAGKPMSLALTPQIPPDCKIDVPRGPATNAGTDASVTVWLEVAECPTSGGSYIRTNSRNNSTSGKTDWAIAVKGGGICHTLPAVAPPAVHPHVTAGHTWATPWVVYHSSDFWWAEVTTTYPTIQHFGQTSCLF